jgi:CRISPR-associated exonuclease Cas4
MFEPPDPIPISALQHWCYCPRQCGLIHLEQAFAENVFTLRGQALHTTVDKPGMETRAGLHVERALPIWHEALGLIGKADVVEYLSDGTPYPVEYKHGSRNKATAIAACDDVQLAAQAMCLESMNQRAVPKGALFYAKSKRRREVNIDAALRAQVADLTTAIRAMLTTGVLPPPTRDESRCQACSLKEICQPEALRQLESSRTWLADLYNPET